MSDPLFRQYESGELGPDGYPPIWHRLPQSPMQMGKDWPLWLAELMPHIHVGWGLKHIVRGLAGNRCVRCGHPYSGGGEWSACDELCTHLGPVRVAAAEGGSVEVHIVERDEVAAMVFDGSDVWARWRILTVHHLDNDKANCRWWNLAALCQRCHLQIQGKVQMARVYPFEHSEWFRPYAAGYYAWTYLGQDLTRAEVDERMDDLLGLERMT